MQESLAIWPYMYVSGTLVLSPQDRIQCILPVLTAPAYKLLSVQTYEDSYLSQGLKCVS